MATLSRVVKYTALPGFIPRIMALLTSGFGQIPFLIALIYQSLRLLPPGHAYTDPRNVGKFGIRHVITEASRHLVFSRKNIDQIIIYFTVLAGLVLLAAQFALLIAAAVIHQPAFAQTFTQLFKLASPHNPGAAQDYAFIILDHVFGVRGIFGSCVDPTVAQCQDLAGNNLPVSPAYPSPYHIALHRLLEFYSRGIFMVGVFIIIYFAIAVTAETAATGTPFAQRFNTTWAPVRLIFFFALLMPLNLGADPTTPEGSRAGLNAAQLITLWAAKGGSNFATNAWGNFNTQLTAAYVAAPAPGVGTYAGGSQNLIARPTVPSVGSLLQFMFTAKTCQMAESAAHGHDVRAYIVRKTEITAGPVPPDSVDFTTTNFTDALVFSRYGTISVRFGVENVTDPQFKDFKGNIFPLCGEITIPITLLDGVNGGATPGSYEVQNLYYQLIQRLWTDTLPGNVGFMKPYAECLVTTSYQPVYNATCNDGVAPDYMPNQDFADVLNIAVNNFINNAATGIPALVARQAANTNWNPTATLRSKGWTGAAVWYNRIAQLNGDFIAAVYAIPKPSRYPFLMEYIADQRRKQNTNISPEDAYDPVLGQNETLEYPPAVGTIIPGAYEEIAPAMRNAFTFWNDVKPHETNFQSSTGNVIIDTINAIFGTSGIFDMANNRNIHPLAQLSAIGKGLMEASIRNVAIGLPGEMVAKVLPPSFLKEIGQAAAGFLKTMGTITMAMSFVMYYILPALPFIYFIFAISAWIKTIFEAMIGMPLWALAHIARMDGEGLPGPAATNGYFLLMEIFLRPILILFGLLASITIFSALVYVLNDVFALVTANVTGFNRIDDPTRPAPVGSLVTLMRSPIDMFFYTALYVIICYLMGLSCFKLIDLVPNNILRWAGVSVSTFKEGAGDPAGTLIGKTYQAGMVASGQIKGGALAALK